MALCYFEGISRRGNQKWGHWQMWGGMNINSNLVDFCKKAFNGRYRGMWISPIYFDDKYFRFTVDFYAEVGAYLFPNKEAASDINIEPIFIMVKGVRYPDGEGDYIEKIISIREISGFDADVVKFVKD